MHQTALIVGAGAGISAAFARALAAQGCRIALASRRPEKLSALAEEVGGLALPCDAADGAAVERAFTELDRHFDRLDVVLFNPSFRTQGPLVDLSPADVERALRVGAFGGFLVGQQATRRMLKQGSGAILFTGASASVKGYARSAPFAMAKFALRGLAQSMARELAPHNIHVAHFVIDGAVRPPGSSEPAGQPDSMLDPDAIAATYLHVLRQPRSAWAWEVELRPWVETF
jgi:NAD(P)-dependent dehydrogenase (short-subunit alcohol dehydrogenase family)